LSIVLLVAFLAALTGCDHDVREPGQPRVQLNALQP